MDKMGKETNKREYGHTIQDTFHFGSQAILYEHSQKQKA
jgi:hypothetical protein